MNSLNFSPLGLETRDIRVYEALFQLKNASLRTVATTTGMNRGTVYETIKKLTEMGLVTFTQKGERRHYNAASPDTLLALIRERRDELKQISPSVTEYIETLKTSRDLPTHFAQFYEGDEGVASILRDVLQTVEQLPDKTYCAVSSRRVSSFIYANFANFTRQRIQMEIFAKVVADGDPEKNAPLSERRILPQGASSLNGYMILYGNKVALISLNEVNQLSGIVIDDAGVSTLQRVVFDQLWASCSAKDY